MHPPEIPGYQWDANKNRYFKVLKTGEMPEGKYTISALAQTQLRQNRQESKIRSKEFTTPRVNSKSKFIANKVLTPKRPKCVYSGSPTELITTFHMFTSTNTLATGSRDGIFQFNNIKQQLDGSIVAIEPFCGVPAVGVVNDNLSTVVVNDTPIKLKSTINVLCSIDNKLTIGTNKGLILLDTSPLEYKLKSVSALARLHNNIVIGTQFGYSVFDLRDKIPKPIECRFITNIGIKDNYMVTTSLMDEMTLHDLRMRRPVFNFSEYENWSTKSHGFAINETCVCVALESSKLRIWDLNGAVLGSVGNASKFTIPKLQWENKMYVAHANKVRML